jgi:non-specific serine/threonine protein kinase
VTPHNVVLGPDGAPLLIDFGMAGLGHAPDDPGGLTPAFAAPERLRGAPPSPAADVYSLATTLLGVLGAQDTRGRALVDDVLRAATSDEPGARPDAGALADALGSVSRR